MNLITPATERSAWKALAHIIRISVTYTCAIFSLLIHAGANGLQPKRRASTSTTRRIASPTKRSKLLLQLAEESGLRERIDAMFQRREDQHHRKPGRSARGAARAQGRVDRRRWRECRAARSTPCSTRWPTSPTACGAARGKVTPANAFATSSTSASAAPTSGR